MSSKHLHRFFILFLSMVIMAACDPYKDEEGQIPITGNQYLTDHTQVAQWTEQEIKNFYQSLPPSLQINFGNKIKYGISVYKVNYKTKFKNKDVLASGLVCVPDAPQTATLPILSFQNGTNTQHSKAPSVNNQDPFLLLVQSIASMGYVVAIPDYLGFGSSSNMFHPYLDKPSTVKSITDMFRAIRELALPKYLDIPLNKNIYLAGYSQGGWASMALKQELEMHPDENFILKGTACGGGPYDMSMLLNFIMGQPTYPMPVFLGYMFHSMINVGNVTFTYSDIFNLPYSNAVPNLYNGLRDHAFINSQLTENLSMLFSHNFITNYKEGEKFSTLRTALANNSVEPWKTTSPLFLRHGEKDTYVPAAVSVITYEGFLQKGTDSKIIDYDILDMMDHNEAIYPFGISAITWLLSLP